VPEIIRRARQLGVLKPGEEVHRCTAYRAAQRMGLPLRQRSTKRDADARRFAYPHRMQMMLCDGKYFRAGVHRRKRVALFFLDDATRYGLGAVVGASESTELFVRGLYEVIRRHGLMDLLFLDNGPGFISDDTHRVVARLASHLVLGTAGYPEGHGKIERFNQTAWAQLLRSLTAVEVDDDYGALELRLNHFLSRQYSQQPHEGLGLKTPQQAWDGDERELRFPSQRWLEERFVLTETRTVSADHILSLDGVLYEVPRGHARTVIEVRRGLLDQGVSILHRGKLVRLHPVDLEANATARRGRGSGQADDDTAKSPVTAAQLAFFRDFGPAVSAGGDFIEPVERDPSTKE
jgi:transposase InsO family protein